MRELIRDFMAVTWLWLDRISLIVSTSSNSSAKVVYKSLKNWVTYVDGWVYEVWDKTDWKSATFCYKAFF